ncbi:MAG: hypothetical protein CEE38_11660 [Planctomycetes bacterium B3_Pla]|nr:MAG: hypothetical protein CEE38_11660 [Planctomycetes bacterium B3_Pla]
MKTFLIGIDDTDNDTSPGTGRLARMLSDECARRGLAPLGVTRHQFLVDPAIPYTSHNSGACIAVECENGLKNRDFIYDFIAGICAKGSDPGVCVASVSDVPGSVIEFADRTTREVVTMPEAFGRAKGTSVALHGLGGTCQGIIGALGSVGLRASGENGRFIDLPGLRELSGCVDAAAFDRIGIALEHCDCERVPGVDDHYETLDWVRPRLIGGKTVLPVQWSQDKNAWIPVDRKKNAIS